MSADNYTYINRKTFEVWACMASQVWTGKRKWTLNDQKMCPLGKGKDLADAIRIAEKYEKELEKNGSCVEYGIAFRLWCK